MYASPASQFAAVCFGGQSELTTLLLLGGHFGIITLGARWYSPPSSADLWSRGPEGIHPVYTSVVRFLFKILPLRQAMLDGIANRPPPVPVDSLLTLDSPPTSPMSSISDSDLI